ncbi:hypothetical protein BDW22DRAFT_139755 [Trametopsis cervina]|nr:hypothetical protein BDW22DRAFT_139755 [Trametopsis cervina]
MTSPFRGAFGMQRAGGALLWAEGVSSLGLRKDVKAAFVAIEDGGNLLHLTTRVLHLVDFWTKHPVVGAGSKWLWRDRK